jgi:hypothetical protein
MNRRQEIALFLIVAVFVATLMFPPWVETTYERSFEDRYPPSPRSENVGYRSVFTWPPNRGSSGNDFHSIDWSRLFLGDLIIAVVGSWLLYALRSKS